MDNYIPQDEVLNAYKQMTYVFIYIYHNNWLIYRINIIYQINESIGKPLDIYKEHS